jgi:hypothetical protein
MSIALLPIPAISPEEYLDLEVESEIRNEYRNGENYSDDRRYPCS